MSLATYPTTVASAGVKEVQEIMLDAYQCLDDGISNKLYFDGSYFDSLGTAIATGVQTTQTTNRPLAGDLYETLYYFDNTEAQRPLVGQGRNYKRIVATAADDGYKYAFPSNLSDENWAVIVIKSGGTSVAGKLKIRSGAGQESVCSFTTSSTANTWERKIFSFKVDGSTNVAFTGSPDFSAITELEITLDAITTQVDVAMVYFANNYLQLIGNELKIRQTCVSEYSIERTLDTAFLTCKQQEERGTGTGKSVMFNVGTKKQDIAVEGLALGDIVKGRNVYTTETINSTNVSNTAIAAGALTKTANLKIDTVYIGNQLMMSYHEATNVPLNAYHYNAGTGVFTFNAFYNGKVPTIKVNSLINLPSIQDKELKLGYVGVFRGKITVNETKYKLYTAKKSQIMFNDLSVNDDFDQENYSYKIYRDDNGVYMTKSLQE